MLPTCREASLEPPSPEPDPTSVEARILRRLLAAGSRGRIPLPVPPGDDAAVLADGLVVTADLLVEGVHFDGRSSAADVGYKAVAVSVSDLAAMGAVPSWMVLTVALGDDSAFDAGLATGVGEACDRWGVELIGGDTTGTPGPRFVGVTMAGRCPGPAVRRSGGRPGDALVVTGIPGLAARGYSDPDAPPAALAALRRPDPPTAFAVAAAPLLTAAMDLSDGLAADLPRLCAASGVGAVVHPAALPDHPDLHGGPVPARALRLAGGDDYALLAAVRPADLAALHTLADAHGVRLTVIGALTAGSAVSPDDGPWPVAPFSHHPGSSR
jgi:thiamine-monophosphate kinase